MNFLNPLVLIGMVAATIPLILHLLNLRKLKTIEFSSLKFLKELQKSKIRKLKIKQILLLILRTLIIVCIVMAFARPTIPTSLPFFQTYSKTSAVIVVDNSFSMDLSDGSGNRLKQAKLTANQIINTFKTGDEIALLDIESANNIAQISFSKNFDYTKDKINKLAPISIPANLNNILKSSSNLAETATNLNKSIFIITDAQENIFNIKNKDTANILSSFNNIYFIIIGNDNISEIKNLSLDSLNMLTSIFNYKKIIELEALVKSYSNTEIKDAVINMSFDSSAVAQRSITVPSNELRPVSIGAPIQKYGPTAVKVEIENDVLNQDNIRYFGFNVPSQPKVLISGSSESVRFISTAIEAVSTENDFARPDKFENQSIGTLPLDQYNIVIISNSSLDDREINNLRNYVEKGGSVLLFPSNSFEITNNYLQKLGFGKAIIKDFSKDNAQKFSSVDKNHPLFEGVFKLNNNEATDIGSPLLLRVVSPSGGNSIISTPSGSFLSENRIGEGRILYIASLPETGWGNLQFTGIFPTLVYRSIIYLTASQDISMFVRVGEPFSLNLPLKYSSENFKVVDNNGVESFVTPIKLPSSLILNFSGFNQPGVWTIYDNKGTFVKQIAVNFDETESIIKPISTDNIEKYLNKIFGDKTNKTIITNNDKLNNEIIRSSVGTELWQLFLILAILLAISEMIVSMTSRPNIENQ